MFFRRHPKIKQLLKYFGAFLAIVIIYFYVGLNEENEIDWGVTFSKSYAESLGLDWQETYIAILDDLGVDNFRIPAYWYEVEPVDDEFDFTVLDFQVDEATKRDAKILLAVGRRLPRWPECHIPEWAKQLSESEQQEKLLEYIPEVINRYKDNPNIVMWQVENEFFLRNFGECPDAAPDLLSREVNLVRSLDDRPIVTTDSGELGGWIGSLRRGDVFGTTMYRIVFNDMIGYAKYPLSPIYYKRRFLLYQPFFRAKQIINVELQAEPWAQTNLVEDSIEVQDKSLSPDQFKKNIGYAQAAGISPTYLWGVEWWYYMKELRDRDVIWEEAKKLWLE